MKSEVEIDLSPLSSGAQNRLKRIMELRNCDKNAALEFALSVGWLAAEKRSQGISPKYILKAKGEK